MAAVLRQVVSLLANIKLSATRPLLPLVSSGMTMNRTVAYELLKLRQSLSIPRQIRRKAGWYQNNRAKFAAKITAIRPFSSASCEIVRADFSSATNLRSLELFSNRLEAISN